MANAFVRSSPSWSSVRAALVFVLATVHAAAMFGQSDKLARRHARIKELHRAEDHAEVAKQLVLQLKEAAGTPWQDSLYAYTFTYGRAVWKSQDADAGIAAAERIVDLVKSTDKNVLHQLDAMDDLARLLYGMGRLLDCARVDSFAMVFADAHKEIPLIRRGKARQRLGLDYGQMGDYGRSLKYYQEAKAVFERSDSLLVLLMSDACNGIGTAYWHLGENRKAEAHYRMALSFLEKSTDAKRNFRMAGTLTNMGILWQSAGDFNRSKADYLEGIRLCGAVADTAKDPVLRDEAILARTRGYVNLATVYFALGDDGRSRELLEMALRERQGILEPDDPKLLGVQDRLADLEMEAKNYAKAEGYVRAYLEACEKYYGPRSEDYARTCAKLGEVYAGLGQDEKADSLFKRSISLSEAMEGADMDSDLASAYRRHAQFYMNQDRHADAVREMEAALAIIRRIHGDAHHKVATYKLLLAEAALGNSDPQTALRYADEALSLLHERVAALNSSSIPQTWPQPHLLPDAFYFKTKAERVLGVNADQRWRTDMDMAILAMQRNKAAYDDEGSQLGFIGQQKAVFDLAIELAGEAYERSPSAAGLDRFLALAEADRSILLKSRLNEFTSIRFTGVPDSVLTHENQLIAALDLDPEDRAATNDLAEREKELADFLERMSRDHPQYFALRYGEPQVTLSDLRSKLLTADRDLLAYAFADEHLYMMIVRRDTAMMLRVPSQGIPEAVKALHEAMRTREKEAYASAAGALYTKVFSPVANLLKSKELLIIPDGELQTVNFETLLFELPEKGKLSDHMLIQKHAISYLLSATTAVQFAGLKAYGPNKVLAFAPGFSDELKESYLAQVRDSSAIDRRFLNYVRQPFAVSTAEGLGSLLSAQVGTGADASEARFREKAGQYGILHLGTHAEMNTTSPLYSRLVLSKDGSGTDPDADGYLHAYEIYELDLRAQLAVLTACETGTGIADVEGVRSLGYSFAYAGCPSLVMSLWSIDEKVSSEIITRFYKHLAGGMPKNLALRQAKLDHLANAPDELAHPYYWAGLVLVGDVEPVDTVGGERYWRWLIGGIVLIGGILLILRVRRERA